MLASTLRLTQIFPGRKQYTPMVIHWSHSDRNGEKREVNCAGICFPLPVLLYFYFLAFPSILLNIG
jgi:hypothetical protein